MSDDEAVVGEGFETGAQEDVLEDLELTDDEAGEVKGGGSPLPQFPKIVKPAGGGAPPPFTGS